MPGVAAILETVERARVPGPLHVHFEPGEEQRGAHDEQGGLGALTGPEVREHVRNVPARGATVFGTQHETTVRFPSANSDQRHATSVRGAGHQVGFAAARGRGDEALLGEPVKNVVGSSTLVHVPRAGR